MQVMRRGRVASWETQRHRGLVRCSSVSLEKKMSLQILISIFEQLPVSQKRLAPMGKR